MAKITLKQSVKPLLRDSHFLATQRAVVFTLLDLFARLDDSPKFF